MEILRSDIESRTFESYHTSISSLPGPQNAMGQPTPLNEFEKIKISQMLPVCRTEELSPVLHLTKWIL